MTSTLAVDEFVTTGSSWTFDIQGVGDGAWWGTALSLTDESLTHLDRDGKTMWTNDEAIFGESEQLDPGRYDYVLERGGRHGTPRFSVLDLPPDIAAAFKKKP